MFLIDILTHQNTTDLTLFLYLQLHLLVTTIDVQITFVNGAQEIIATTLHIIKENILVVVLGHPRRQLTDIISTPVFTWRGGTQITITKVEMMWKQFLESLQSAVMIHVTATRDITMKVGRVITSLGVPRTTHLPVGRTLHLQLI
jgi:hypothetical protein